MTDPDASAQNAAAPVPLQARRPRAPRAPPPPANIWARIKEHKVLQWSLAYLGAALALAHGQELLAHTFHWPEVIGRLLIATLIVGFPIAIALAWYHGHKGLTRVSAGEMMMMSILLVMGAGLLVVLVRAPEEQATELGIRTQRPPDPSTDDSTGVPRASIAVVPFANLTGDPAKEYFSDGMAEELIDALAHVPGIKVPARTSSFAYKGRNVDIRRIAQDLGVATVLEGSVRSAGERIRVTAQLVDARSGYHVWSQTYDRKFADIFKLQDEVAAAIVQALGGYVNAMVPAPAVRPPPTHDLEAYQLYLQARSVIRGTEESMRRSISLYDQALARDPNFARAWAGRAESRTILLVLGRPAPDVLEDAERDAMKALALDPGLAEAHEALGMTNARRRNLLQAEVNFRAALAADASDARIQARHATWVLVPAGRLRQAHLELSQAYRLAPADGVVVARFSSVASRMGLDTEAVELADLAVQLGGSPRSYPLLLIYTNASIRSARYVEATEHAVDILPPDIRGAGGTEVMKLVYAALSDPSRKPAASQALQDLIRKMESGGIDPTARELFVQMFTMLGALDAAYRSYDEFARFGPVNLAGSIWAPEMRAFRKDPRFQQVVTRENLIEYWKQYGPPDDCDLQDGKLTCR